MTPDDAELRWIEDCAQRLAHLLATRVAVTPPGGAGLWPRRPGSGRQRRPSPARHGSCWSALGGSPAGRVRHRARRRRARPGVPSDCWSISRRRSWSPWLEALPFRPAGQPRTGRPRRLRRDGCEPLCARSTRTRAVPAPPAWSATTAGTRLPGGRGDSRQAGRELAIVSTLDLDTHPWGARWVLRDDCADDSRSQQPASAPARGSGQPSAAASEGGSSVPGTSSISRARTRPSISSRIRRTVSTGCPAGSSSSQSR